MGLSGISDKIIKYWLAVGLILSTAGIECGADLISGQIRFEHPMTVTNERGLKIVKERIALQMEPQFTAFLQLIEDADRGLQFVPDPPESMDIMGGYEKNSNSGRMANWLLCNSQTAYACALAWILTGKTGYADKAVEILEAWTEKDTSFTGKNRGLQLGLKVICEPQLLDQFI